MTAGPTTEPVDDGGVAVRAVADGVWVATTPLGPAASDPARRSECGERLVHALVDLVAPGPAPGRLVHAPGGAPALRGRPDLRISISHDGAWLAAAVALHRPVGVDLQEPIAASGGRLATRCLANHVDAVGRLPAAELDREVAWVWTVQESCVKARGTGLAGRPWTLDVAPFAVRGTVAELSWQRMVDALPIPLSCAYGTDPRESGPSAFSSPV